MPHSFKRVQISWDSKAKGAVDGGASNVGGRNAS